MIIHSFIKTKIKNVFKMLLKWKLYGILRSYFLTTILGKWLEVLIFTYLQMTANPNCNIP